MVLIKCPECGKDVSDEAVSCPSCGYSIKKYIAEKKQELKQEEKSDKSKKLAVKGIIILIAIILIVSIAIFVGIQKKQDKRALMNLNLLFSHTEDISEYRTYAVMEIDGEYYYHEIGANSAISKISDRLSNLDICVAYIDEHYSESRNAIDNKIKEETNYSCITWEEYRKSLESNYYIDEDISNRERAKQIVSKYVDSKVDK